MKEKRSTIFFEKKYFSLLIVFICILIYIGGYYFYSSETKNIRREKHEEIKAISDLKSSQIIQWRNERLSEAEFFSKNENSIEAVNKIISRKDTIPAIDYFYNRLSVIKKNHHYRNIYITTPDNKILFTLDKQFSKPDSSIQDEISEAIKIRDIVFADFHFSQPDSVALDFIGPIVDNNKVIALIIFHIDPYLFLFPYIETWPTPSHTSETMLVRKEKDSVLFLNRVRFLNYPASKLRFSIKDTLKPAVQAILGFKGIFEGYDYRNVKVLANIQKLESTPWYMVTKVDQSEIYEELNFRSVVIILFTILLMLITGFGIFFIYYRNQRKLDKEYSEDLEERVEERTKQLTHAKSILEMTNNELESFSYSVSHDLRAPLRAIKSFSNILKEELLKNKNPELISATDNIINTSAQMDKMISELLDFSRKTRKPISTEEIDMNLLFSDCYKEISREYPDKNIKFELENLPDGCGDPSLIKHVVNNLLSNAVKFSSFQDIPLIKAKGYKKKSESVYSIEDNGVGFEPEYSDKLFNIFQRLHTSEEFEGNGVGLAIVERIIVRHGGKVWAEGHPGKGSIFYFTLPVKDIFAS